MSARNGHAAPDGHAPDAHAPDAHAADLRETIVIRNVSKFYGEILGVNRVNLIIRPGVTSLVGPNGSGKTTLMNLLSGLLQPTRGEITVLGVPVADAERLGRRVGYCTQVDSFPSGMTGYDFVYGFLRVGGFGPADAKARAWSAIERVDLVDAAKRKVAGYSKGMRQRIKLAGAISHGPRALILDEPMNGLDPMARAEMAALFQALAAEGHFVIVSSHILHEVDTLSDAVVVINHGYVLAEGDIHDVRGAMDADHPTGILIRCDNPGLLARHAFEYDHVIEARLHDDGQGLLVRTRDAEKFFRALGEIALTADLTIDSVTPADDDVEAVYRYLIGTSGETT